MKERRGEKYFLNKSSLRWTRGALLCSECTYLVALALRHVIFLPTKGPSRRRVGGDGKKRPLHLMERQQERDRVEGWTPLLRMPELLAEGWSKGGGHRCCQRGRERWRAQLRPLRHSKCKGVDPPHQPLNPLEHTPALPQHPHVCRGSQKNAALSGFLAIFMVINVLS